MSRSNSHADANTPITAEALAALGFRKFAWNEAQHEYWVSLNKGGTTSAQWERRLSVCFKWAGYADVFVRVVVDRSQVELRGAETIADLRVAYRLWSGREMPGNKED